MDHYSKKLKLPKYDGEHRNGEEAKKWLTNMESYFEIKESSSFGKTCIVVYQLKGMAAIWWEDMLIVKQNQNQA